MNKKTKHDFSIRNTSSRRNISAQTSKIYNYYTYYLYSATGETGLTGGTRVSVTTQKRNPKKKKNIKSKALSPFLPVNKILLNKENDHNPETTDTSLSEKYDMSHTSSDDFITKAKDTKNTNDDDK